MVLLSILWTAAVVSVYSMAAWHCPNTIQKLDSKLSRIFFSKNGELNWICIGFNYYYCNTMSYNIKSWIIFWYYLSSPLDKLLLLFCKLGLRIVSYLICFFVSHVFLWAWRILHKLKVAVHMHTVPKNEKIRNLITISNFTITNIPLSMQTRQVLR